MRAVWTLLLTAVLWVAAPLQAAENVTYYHNDALGSPVAATDADGNLLWREIYEPFGRRFEQDPSSDGNSRWYTGHQETDYGLVYMGARHYDPILGRFLSVDPVRFKESNSYSFNRYIYANQNPFIFFDPNGEQPVRYYQSSGYGQPMIESSGTEDAATVLTFMIPPAKAKALVRVLSGPSQKGKSAGDLIPGPAEARGSGGAQTVAPKPGSAGGPGAGKDFSRPVKDAAREESGNTCVFCGAPTKRTSGPDPQRSHIDHAIPKSRGGNNTIDNAQNTCQTCNLEKGARTTEEYLKQTGQ